jgi:hypothetical protein
MKNLLLIAAALFATLAAHAEETTGVGITAGSPWGLTGRTWMNTENSIDYGFGWDLLNSSKFQVYGDYLWSRPDTFEINGEKFDLFFGGGLVLRTHSATDENTAVFGPRFPVGVSYFFAHPDLEVFGALALDVGLIPKSDVFVDVVAGARFNLY